MIIFDIGNIEFDSKLDIDKELVLTYDGGGYEGTEYLNKEKAFELMEHLVKVFEFTDYEIGGLQSNG